MDPYLKSVCGAATQSVARVRTQISQAESFIEASETGWAPFRH